MKLVGRIEEQATIKAALGRIRTAGAAVTIVGGPGAGKTALLDVAHEMAREAGFTVLRCNGSRHDMADQLWHLHEVLYPLLDAVPLLPRTQQAALSAAFGGLDEPTPDLRPVRLAALGLLEQSAAHRPVVLLVDDWQWIDPATADALAFAARELTTSPVVVLATSRPPAGLDRGAPLDGQTLHLPPMSEIDAWELLDHRPNLSADERSTIVTFAQGNPLALVECAAATARALTPALQDAATPPLTERLVSSFLEETAMQTLPTASRILLLCAAAGSGTTTADLLRAGRLVGAESVAAEELTRRRLLDLTSEAPVFPQPLLAAAVYADAPMSDRITVHRALAEVTDDPMRAAMHLAAGTPHQDSAVADTLERAATAAAAQGCLTQAVDALRWSAELSPEPAARARRLRDAAELARQTGPASVTDRLLRHAQVAAGESSSVAALAITEAAARSGRGTGAGDIQLLLALSRRLARLDDRSAATERLDLLSAIAVLSTTYGKAHDVVTAATAELAALQLDEHDPVRAASLAILDPAGYGGSLKGRLSELLADARDRPALLAIYGLAAEAMHDLDLAIKAHDAAQRSLRAGGRAADLAHELVSLSFLRVLKGDPHRAYVEASEARRIAKRLGLGAIEAEAHAAIALSQAWAGDRHEFDAAMKHSRDAANASWTSTPARRGWAAGLVALVDGRYRNAWVDLQAAAAHPATAASAAADLTEAAVLSGRTHLAAQHVAAAEERAETYGSQQLAASAHRARALIDTAADADERYEASIAAAHAAGALLERGRSHLTFGRWLRRGRRIVRAREHLSAAMAVFHTTGAHPWATLAERELEAAGVQLTRATAPPQSRNERLTPQERQIAELAADGLTNREIGNQLLLSHRTISTHLYRAFAKLSITDRRQVGEALIGDR
ncbi:AAA family ATPase [Micromonospora sp. CA-240977]|uniref:AAA family ATPase n=1 Tax=Micromonospora sp. CA-240977 TaxID=3239957 RepID=UPI003D8C0F5D